MPVVCRIRRVRVARHAIERFIDHDLYFLLMKPDSIKRRTAPSKPPGYYGKWERGCIVKAALSRKHKVEDRVDAIMRP